MADVVTPPTSDLKRLSKVMDGLGALAASGAATHVKNFSRHFYGTAQDVALLKAIVTKVEALATPYVDAATSQETVKLFDDKVDGAIKAAGALYEARVAPTTTPLVAKAVGVYKSAKGATALASAKLPKDAEAFLALRDEWFVTMESVLGDLNALSAAVPKASLAYLQAAIEKAKHALPADSKGAMDAVHVAWEKLVAFPSVAAVVATAAPRVRAAKSVAMQAYTTVLESERYSLHVAPYVEKYAPAVIKNKLVTPPSSPDKAAAEEPSAAEEMSSADEE